MQTILVMIAIGMILIFILGWVFGSIIRNEDSGPLFIIPLLTTLAFGASIIGQVIEQTESINSASVHQAVVLCETNGGLKTLDQREAVCANGVAFNTRSLKQPEKQ